MNNICVWVSNGMINRENGKPAIINNNYKIKIWIKNGIPTDAVYNAISGINLLFDDNVTIAVQSLIKAVDDFCP